MMIVVQLVGGCDDDVVTVGGGCDDNWKGGRNSFLRINS